MLMRSRLMVGVAGVLAIVGGGTVWMNAASSPSRPAGGTSATSDAPGYGWYQSMMGSFPGNSMMGGGGYSWMGGRRGYAWMMGGAGAPGWQRGQDLPGFMMGSAGDPGTAMGSAFANAPGPRVSMSDATRLANTVPAGAQVNKSGNSIVFTTKAVNLAIVASMSGSADDKFQVAGLVNPSITVPRGSKVTIDFVNGDSGMAHGVAVVPYGAAQSSMPMMSDAPSFSRAALWFLGDATSAGAHRGTIRFSADKTGTYQYLCPVPGHALKGMYGIFNVA